MKTHKFLGRPLTVAVVIAAAVAGFTFFSTRGRGSAEVNTGVETVIGSVAINKEFIAAQLGNAIRGNLFPTSIDLALDGGPKKAIVQYALQQEAQAQMEKLMNLYKPDYGAFVALDAKTGRILSMVSFSREHQVENLALQATFPAASIFKVVTASAALDLAKASPETVVPFNGAFHTLYKKNVVDNRENRWTRRMTMREAFARSVNTFFAKLGLFYVGPANLKQYAERYNFNHPIRADVPVQTGFAKFSEDDPWSVVTAASGFTRDNTMSPLQGAMIAAAVANDGVMMEPYLVESLHEETGSPLYQAQVKEASIVVDKASAEKLRELFHETVRSGTSRKSFRSTVRRAKWDEVEFGGKTGSLTGLNPAGKCDWFVGYARYRDQRIAVAALTVNEKKWRVKSSMLANQYLTTYLGNVMTAEKTRGDYAAK
jgi:cell division protein FtsI/penicillin-binding protein 2